MGIFLWKLLLYRLAESPDLGQACERDLPGGAAGPQQLLVAHHRQLRHLPQTHRHQKKALRELCVSAGDRR